ncbi:hypothetical protein [Sulfodiicoccus acidiphilus]|uniref:hypothetical protein n=1 Tax=Sulfodiicoccus acidiphilus TaxID=1670455 RepID=UPI000F819D89|nr:hypothetical protein [Sulfodiicoccus acidiphilus]
MVLTTLLPSSIECLTKLREEQAAASISFKGLDVMGESPLLFKWEWISDPLDCPPNETCKPESMVGTMNPLGGNPRPFQGGEEVSS